MNEAQAGQLTFFGRVPDWERDAYSYGRKGTVHLVSRHRKGSVLTFCGAERLIDRVDDLVQIVDHPTAHTEGWDGRKRCYYCQKQLEAMRDLAIESSDEITEENWRSFYEDEPEHDWRDLLDG